MYYSFGFVASLLGSSIVAGFLGALLGVGGGMIIVPFLVLIYHLPMKFAVATSIVSVIATSNAGGSKYVDQRITNLRLAMFLEIATTLGALSGSVLALYLRDWIMLLVFAALLLYLAVASYTTRNLDDQRIASGEFANAPQDRLARWLNLRGSYRDEAAQKTVEYVINGSLIGAGISYFGGVTSGLLGVGGGVLKVSAMNRYMNVPMKVAVATSKLMIGVTAAVGSILFFVAGLIHFNVVAPVAIGTTVGATLGTMVMNRLRSASLKLVFTVLVGYLAYGMIARALAIGFNIHLPNLT
jgi:uncharacterized membrane protein YfcA